MYMKPKNLGKGTATNANRGGWQNKLKQIIKGVIHLKASGKGNVSYQTQADREDRLFRIFNTLTKKLKFGIEDPANLKPKHVTSLVQHWVSEELDASTIENYLSLLRIFCTWINKPGMVKGVEAYAPGVRRSYAAQKDRSPRTNGVDIWQMWDKVYEMDKYVAAQLLLVIAFGARKREVVMFMPLIGDKGSYVELISGTKKKKPRTLPIDTSFKREVMDVLKEFAKARGYAKAHIANPNKTLAQNEKRYSYVMGACGMTKNDLGFTGHSFRQEYLNDELERRGVIPTIRGGSGKAGSYLETDIAYHQVSGQAGHGRKYVVTAYSGSLRQKLQTENICDGTLQSRAITSNEQSLEQFALRKNLLITK